MRKLILVGFLVLVAMIPTLVLAGDVYSPTVEATFNNEAKFTTPGLRGAKGSANITYSETMHEWAISMNFSGLIAKHEYIFQISAQDQLMKRIDIFVTSDKTGKIKTTETLGNLDTYDDKYLNDPVFGGFRLNEQYSQFDIDYGYYGYTILRLIDLSGESGGMVLAEIETTPETNPYLPEYPKATMVMRAREDGYRGALVFY